MITIINISLNKLRVLQNLTAEQTLINIFISPQPKQKLNHIQSTIILTKLHQSTQCAEGFKPLYNI